VTPAARSLALLALLLPLAAGACGAPTSGKSAVQLWEENCQRCHGPDGTGDPAQRTLAPNVDLTRSPAVRAGDRLRIYQKISYGYGTMPGFAHRLERGDLELLADHALTFARR
jgi:mono/diheme cytochrome c family protein